MAVQIKPDTRTRLYDAALGGDVHLLLNLLQEDPLVLHRCIIEKSGRFMSSPLHVSANLGHVQFTEKILEKMPSMCFVHDQDGRTPVHGAAVNGKIEVLKMFVLENPLAVWERTTAGETVLHLCVKHSQLAALESLVEITADGELLNAEDISGNTALHLAVAGKQAAMVEFLITRRRIEKNAMNKKGMTVVDTHRKSRKDLEADRSIEQSLKRARALPAKEARLRRQSDSTWLEQQRSSLMVVASLIATMEFQVGINPPGGFWQEMQTPKIGIDGHFAGESIMSYLSWKSYKILLFSNTIGLISSLITILLLISGLPFKQFVVFILRITLWISVTATAMTYFLAVGFVTKGDGKEQDDAFFNAFGYSLMAWVCLTGIVLLVHLVRYILKKIGWQRRQWIINFCKRSY